MNHWRWTTRVSLLRRPRPLSWVEECKIFRSRCLTFAPRTARRCRSAAGHYSITSRTGLRTWHQRSVDLVSLQAPCLKDRAVVNLIEHGARHANPDTAPGGGSYFLSPFEVAARSLNVELIKTRVAS